MTRNLAISLITLLFGLSACVPTATRTPSPIQPTATVARSDAPTPIPTRPVYAPGTLVDYVAQTGDTLPALAAHFNTTEDEIRAANPVLPDQVTTLPPGLPMQIPIYYAPLWGSAFQILPDSLFVNGPAQVGFDTTAFVDAHPGWLKAYRTYAAGETRSGAALVDYIAQTFSLSPRLLLALLEYQTGALSNPSPPSDLDEYPLGFTDRDHRGLYLQLVWAANRLNNGYYGWRTGRLETIPLQDGREERPDPWQNAASAGLMYYLAAVLPPNAYVQAISPDGFIQTYRTLFGDPWSAAEPHIPGSLTQPEMHLPFEPGRRWAYTGGPHTGWGEGDPLAALDFAPPSTAGGCTPSNEWATAIAAGTVVRSETGIVVLDLDGDGDERTGWVVFYLHVGTPGRASVGQVVQADAPIGHPSCEGGRTTGTHVHIARKYNGEWIPADGPLAFNLDGWIAHNGPAPYLGTLTRFGNTVTACDCADANSLIERPKATPTP